MSNTITENLMHTNELILLFAKTNGIALVDKPQAVERVEENFEMREVYYQSPQERLRARVYATGNKWAIENFNATH